MYLPAILTVSQTRFLKHRSPFLISSKSFSSKLAIKGVRKLGSVNRYLLFLTVESKTMYYGITVKSKSSQDWESFRRTLQK